jgi:hypothetical protein
LKAGNCGGARSGWGTFEKMGGAKR